MAKKTIILSALVCSGTLALGASSLWSQTSETPTERGSGSQSGQSSGGGAAKSGQLSSTQITQLQQALKSKGHDPGPIDGVMNSNTQQAIRAFQQANGMQATGTVDAQTAAALGVSKGGSGTGAGSSRSESGSPSGSGSGAGSSEGSRGGSSSGGGTTPGGSTSGEKRGGGSSGGGY